MARQPDSAPTTEQLVDELMAMDEKVRRAGGVHLFGLPPDAPSRRAYFLSLDRKSVEAFLLNAQRSARRIDRLLGPGPDVYDRFGRPIADKSG